MKKKQTGRLCIQRVAVGERDCSGARYCWIRCFITSNKNDKKT